MSGSFQTWLKTSNEAAPFRIAFDLVDQMPHQHRLRVITFDAVRSQAERAWEETKRLLWSDK